MKKVLSLVAGIFLLLSTFQPIGAFASSDKRTTSTPISLMANVTKATIPPIKAKRYDQDFHNPVDYPLVDPGEYIGTLIDSVDSIHYLFYNMTTDYSASKMGVQIGYQDNDTFKDSYLNVEFFTNKNGTMTYLGYSSYDTKNVGSGKLTSIVDKSLYAQDPYIYIRIGISASESDAYYSDVTYFKVENPFYSGKPVSSQPKTYELISNESTNGNSSESTGSFKINNYQYAFNKKIQPSAYKMDYVKPFNIKKFETKMLRKNQFSVKSLDQVGDTRSFWTANLVTGDYDQLQMSLIYSGSHSNVWVFSNQLTTPQATLLGTEFDQKIYSSDTKNFGSESDVDGNGKVNILCYDIQDGFNGNGGYVAGYFDPQDLFNVTYSNNGEVFYIDTNPLMGTGSTKNVTAAYSTLAHEFQHMINFNQKVLVQGNLEMDTWMNEGLSMAAEQLYLDHGLQDRIDYYNYDPEIAAGHSLLNWDSYGDVLANYSLSYLFMQYLEIQCGQGGSIFKELINDPHSDYQAVEDIVHKYIDPNMTLGQFMTDFRAALLLKQSTGLNGFHGNSTFNSLMPRNYYGDARSLDGGGAVLKPISSTNNFTVPTDKGTDVTYTTLKVNLPKTPTVNPVGDNSSVVTGKADTNVNVYVTYIGKLLGHVATDKYGQFRVAISKQPAGHVLHIYAEDILGNRSNYAAVTVLDKTAPSTPKVNPIDDNDKTITGNAEADSKVTIKIGSKVFSVVSVDKYGNFKLGIKPFKAGTKLTFTATDRAGNVSKPVTLTVADKTPPKTLTVNKVYHTSNYVKGKTEAYATITIKNGNKTLASKKADSKGNFTLYIPKQKKGSVLTVYASDASHNTRSLKVKVY